LHHYASTDIDPLSLHDALPIYFPRSQKRWMMRMHGMLEGAGRRFWPIFAGVLVVEAQKRVYQGVPVPARASRRVFVLVLSPQGADRKSTRLNSSHVKISYAVFC